MNDQQVIEIPLEPSTDNAVSPSDVRRIARLRGILHISCAYIDHADMALILGCSVATVYRNVKAGNIPAPELVAGKPRWRVDSLKAL